MAKTYRKPCTADRRSKRAATVRAAKRDDRTAKASA